MDIEAKEKLACAVKYIQVLEEFHAYGDDIDNRIAEVEDKFQQDKENAIGVWEWMRKISKGVLIGFAVFIVICIITILNDDWRKADNAIAIGAVILTVAAFFAFKISTQKVKKIERNYQVIYDVEVKPKLDELDAEGYKMLDMRQKFIDENVHYLEVLPYNYRNAQAATYLFLAIDSGRADNMKEAYNLYEEQLHRWKMEEIAQQSAEAQEYAAMAMAKLNDQQAEANAHLQAIEFIQYMQYLDNKNKQ